MDSNTRVLKAVGAQLPDGSVAVADTYNGAVRHYDPRTGQVATLARGLAEPSDVLLDVSGEQPLLVVVETNADRLVRVPVPAAAQRVDEGAAQTQRPRTRLAPGALTVDVREPVGAIVARVREAWGV